MFVAPTPEDLNEQLPQFEILEILGQGGMGAVYKARQPKLNRLVAIKLLPSFDGPDEHNFAERFEREAQVMAQLHHPNIVMVHDFGETESGMRYIVMEYVDGADLHGAIQTGKLNVRHALAWIPQICSALQYAHERGLVHRDIKPANIFISNEGEVKVGDFGLAKIGGGRQETSLTVTNVSMGTPDYAPPEALEDGVEVDHRGDVYSLGVLAYELLTGKVPRGAWQAPSNLVDVDPRFDQVIVKAMLPDRDQRYQTVAQMSEALEKIASTPAGAEAGPKQLNVGNTGPVSVKSERQTPEKRGLSGGLIAATAIGVLLLIGALAAILTHQQTKKQPGDVAADDSPAAADLAKRRGKGGGGAKGDRRPDQRPGPGGKRPGRVLPQTSDDPDPSPPNPRPIAAALREPVPEGWIGAFRDLQEAPGWTFRPDGLHLDAKTGGPRPKQALTAEMSGSYTIKASFLRKEGAGDIVMLLPIDGERYAPLHFHGSGEFSGIAGIDGRPLDDAQNPTRVPSPVETGRSHLAQVKVHLNGSRARVSAELDGQQLFRWTGTTDQLPTAGLWQPADKTKLVIGAQSDTHFGMVQVRNEAGSIAAPTTPMDSGQSSPQEGWIDALEGLDVPAGIVRGDWRLTSQGLERRFFDAAFCLFELPQKPGTAYDLKLKLRWIGDARENIVVILPLGERFIPLHFAIGGGQFFGFPLDGVLPSDPANRTRKPSPIRSDRDTAVEIQVRRLDSNVRLAVGVNGQLMADWTGTIDRLPDRSRWTMRDTGKIGLGAMAPARFSEIRLRDATVLSKEAMVKLNDQLGPLKSEFEAKISQVADPGLQAKIDNLLKNYRGALNRLVAGNSAPAKAAAQQELDRLEAGEPMEAEDPPNMPGEVQKVRAVFRTEMAKLERNKLAANLPAHTAYVNALQELRNQYASRGGLAAAGYIGTLIEPLEAKIAQIRASAPTGLAGSQAFAQSADFKQALTLKSGLERKRKEFSRPLDDLRDKFLGQLRRLASQFANQGNELAAGAVRAEIAAHVGENPGPVPGSPRQLKETRELFDRQSAPLKISVERKMFPLTKAYLTKLEEMQQKMSRAEDPGLKALSEEIESTRNELEKVDRMLVEAGVSVNGSDLLVDNFERRDFGREWQVDGAELKDGRVTSLESFKTLTTTKEFRGDFKIEADLEKEGDFNHPEWDFRIELVGTGIDCFFRFDTESMDVIVLNTVGADQKAAYTRPDHPNKGRATLTHKNGRLRLEFKTYRNTLQTEWVPAPGLDRTKVRFHLGGGPNSPRHLDNVRVEQLD